MNGACAYGEKSNCGYGTAVGVLAFLGLLVFLVLDALFDNLSNVDHRKYIVIGDIAFSGSIFLFQFSCFLSGFKSCLHLFYGKLFLMRFE